jgi:exosome complex exonuclease DIS3/RRP44
VKLAADAAAYLVIDTNVALHQLDFLEHPAITDVIVTKTVLEEVGARARRGRLWHGSSPQQAGGGW